MGFWRGRSFQATPTGRARLWYRHVFAGRAGLRCGKFILAGSSGLGGGFAGFLSLAGWWGLAGWRGLARRLGHGRWV